MQLEWVAGMVLKSRKFAGCLAQGMVILLYLVFPQFSHLGFLFFEYLTVRPVIVDKVSPFLPQGVRGDFGAGPAGEMQPVPFYALELSPMAFSLLIQLLLLAVFFVVVYRKWQNPANHSLGKHFALVFYAVLQVLMLGNLLPQIEQWAHDSGRLSRFPPEGLSIAVLSLAGYFGFFVSLLLIGIVTPSRHEAIRGLRRAVRSGLPRVPSGADEASGLWHALGLAVLTSVGLGVLTASLIDTGMYAEFETRWFEFLKLPLLLFLLNMTLYCLIEYMGMIRFLFFVVLVWLLPFLAAMIMAGMSDALINPAVYLAALSPIGCVVFAVLDPFRLFERADEIPVEIQYSLDLCLVFYTILVADMITFLRKRYRRYRLEAEVQTTPEPAPVAPENQP